MARTYLDFDLLIERAGEGYRSRVLDSPAGQAASDFVLPLSPLELENFLLRVTRSLGDIRRKVRRLEAPERQLVREFGARLFDAVFSDSVLNALRASLNEANRKDAGLRIRLRLTDVPELANVPWEYLYNPMSSQFLCLSIDTPVVRYVDLPTGVRSLAVSPPLRVLVMISSPTDFAQLDVAQEWAQLEGALGELADRGQVSLQRLETATLASLQRPLRLGEYHIFHFIGHGGFDEQAQDGALLLEGENGRGRLVTGQDLGVMLNGHRSLRLVVLNACEGARSSASDPFAGVATSLLHQGVPAAIAMQFEITDSAAITFAQEFYGALADGYPIDAAVAESRRAIFAQANEFEWATPVLYMRSPNGRIFKVSPRLPGKPPGEQHAAERRAAEERAAEQRAREQAEKEAADREAAERAREQEAADREAADREAADREAADREAADREAADQRAREQAEKEAPDQEAADQRAREQEAAGQAEREAREQQERSVGKSLRHWVWTALAAMAVIIVLTVVVAAFAGPEPIDGVLILGLAVLGWGVGQASSRRVQVALGALAVMVALLFGSTPEQDPVEGFVQGLGFALIGLGFWAALRERDRP
jgi:hypothetical protein